VFVGVGIEFYDGYLKRKEAAAVASEKAKLK
jgi:hypothetical protein